VTKRERIAKAWFIYINGLKGRTLDWDSPRTQKEFYLAGADAVLAALKIKEDA
jgi:hypothetical protein